MGAQPSLFDEAPSQAPPEAQARPRPSEAATAPHGRQSGRTERAEPDDWWAAPPAARRCYREDRLGEYLNPEPRVE